MIRNIKIILILITFLGFIVCKNTSEKNDNTLFQEEVSNEENQKLAINVLKEFYLSVYKDENNNDYLKYKFVSSRLLQKIDSLSSSDDLILDYDPFIKGQDYSGEAIKATLNIIPLKNKDKFRVSFLLFGEENEEKTNIDIALIKAENGRFLIDRILNDEHLK